MLGIGRLLRRITNVLLRRGVERDLEEEIRFHLEMQASLHVARGMTAGDARALAAREFGAVTRHKESVRDVRGISMVDDLTRDARFATRVLRRSPGFTAVAIITLALGIGATTATFSVVNGVLLRPLPFGQSERLTELFERNEQHGRSAVSWPNFQDWRAQSHSFESMAAFRDWETTVLGSSEAVRVPICFASAEFFRMLRVSPELGRTFLPPESTEGGPAVAVVSDAFWRRYLGASRDLGKKPLRFGDRTYTVVGVMPPDFAFPERAQIWAPIEPENRGMGRGGHNDETLARLAPGVTIAQARAELDVIAARLKVRYPADNSAVGADVASLRDEIVGPVRTYLHLLLGAVIFVLLVACVNLASANLARAAARGREMALRTALGAGRARLVRQLLTENVLLAVLGGIAGLLIAAWLMRVLVALGPSTLPRAREIGIDSRVMIFALGLSAMTGILIGLVPVAQLRSSRLREAIADGGRGAVSGAGSWLRNVLVGAEVALALVLLVGAGLLVRSFSALLSENPGYDPRGVMTIDVSLPPSKFQDGAIASYFDATLQAVRSLPGVEQVGLINIVPLRRPGFGSGLAIDGRPGEVKYAGYRVVSEEYFHTMRVPLVAGRLFNASDDSTAAHVTVINQAMARIFFAGDNPLGKRVRSLGMDNHRDVWLTVIGVVADVRSTAMGKPAGPESYVFYRQRPERAGDATIVLRTSAPSPTIAPALRARVRSVDAEVPAELATMSQVIVRSVADRKFTMLILAGFGVLALLLAAVGIYGVLSYSVVRRTPEIGVRMALGAQRGHVLRMVMRESMTPVVLGVVVGGCAAVALTRLMRTLLYAISPTDAPTFVIVIAVLTAVAALASLIPSLRATGIDPAVVLRGE